MEHRIRRVVVMDQHVLVAQNLAEELQMLFSGCEIVVFDPAQIDQLHRAAPFDAAFVSSSALPKLGLNGAGLARRIVAYGAMGQSRPVSGHQQAGAMETLPWPLEESALHALINRMNAAP